MGKRSSPLLYIHQHKEIEVEADAQAFFYRPKGETFKKTSEESKQSKSEINDTYLSTKLQVLNSIPEGVNPVIELSINGESHVGVLKEIKEGIIVLRTQKIPYKIECSLSEVRSIKIISF